MYIHMYNVIRELDILLFSSISSSPPPPPPSGVSRRTPDHHSPSAVLHAAAPVSPISPALRPPPPPPPATAAAAATFELFCSRYSYGTRSAHSWRLSPATDNKSATVCVGTDFAASRTSFGTSMALVWCAFCLIFVAVLLQNLSHGSTLADGTVLQHSLMPGSTLIPAGIQPIVSYNQQVCCLCFLCHVKFHVQYLKRSRMVQSSVS